MQQSSIERVIERDNWDDRIMFVEERNSGVPQRKDIQLYLDRKRREKFITDTRKLMKMQNENSTLGI
jgi:hypothetical protein